MDINVEELENAIEVLEGYLYGEGELSNKKVEKIKNLLEDILEQVAE